MGKILSIVVPAYNVENYIDKCLASFEDLSVLNDVEILVVNDGSTDKTVEHVQKFCDKYPDSYRLFTKENGGHGSTINYAIQKATGKYFKVVDGDDWVDKALLPEFIKLLKKTKSDVISSDFRLIQDKTWKILKCRRACHNDFHYGKEWGFAEAVMEPIVTIHSMTVCTSVLKENDIKLTEKCFYEDQEFIMFPIPYCSSIYFSDLALYQYRIGREGQSVDMKKMIKQHDQHMRIMNSLFDYYDAHSDLPTYKQNYLARGIAEAVDDEYQIYLAMGNTPEAKQGIIEFDQRLMHEQPDIYMACQRKTVWFLRKSRFKLFMLGTIAYKILK